MRLSRVLRTGALAAALSLSVAACGGGNDEGGSGKSLVQKAQDGEALTVGIKYDQPGLGLKTAEGEFEGFDVDVAEYVAEQLGADPNALEFAEAQSAERENLLDKGEVDFIVATYSITQERHNAVDFAGPYFVAHQDLLVRSGDNEITGPDSLDNNKKLCSVSGSTPAQNVKENYAQGVQLLERGKYTDCLVSLRNGEVDALTTDDVILAGYAAQYGDDFKLVGEGFSDENYGIGIPEGDGSEGELNDAITSMQDSGEWQASLEEHLADNYEIPDPPEITQQAGEEVSEQ